MLPSPPHWATSRPPGRSAPCSARASAAWSAIQWNVAVDSSASAGSGSASAVEVGLHVGHPLVAEAVPRRGEHGG